MIALAVSIPLIAISWTVFEETMVYEMIENGLAKMMMEVWINSAN